LHVVALAIAEHSREHEDDCAFHWQTARALHDSAFGSRLHACWQICLVVSNVHAGSPLHAAWFTPYRCWHVFTQVPLEFTAHMNGYAAHAPAVSVEHGGRQVPVLASNMQRCEPSQSLWVL